MVSERGRAKTLEVFGEPLTPEQVVTRICDDVREQGLGAVLHYTEQLDGVALSAETLRVPARPLEAAHAQADPAFLAAVRRIRDNILEFQRAILHHDVRLERPDGVYLQHRYVPLRRVGICVPGGAAAYPSTVLMTAVPAQAAGVEQLAIVAPPTPFGADNPNVLATCHELGVDGSVSRGRSAGRGRTGVRRRVAAGASTRSSGPGTCSSRWPNDTSTARSTSTRSPGRAKWW